MIAEREKWIDTAKAVAIILVILGHAGDALTGWFNFQFVYGFHLVIFYIISGYVTKKRPLDISFVRKKYVRLMVPYFLTCFAVLLIDIFNYFFIYKERSIVFITEIIAKDLTRSFFASGTNNYLGEIEMGGFIGAVWFLPALFFSVLIFQLLVNKIHDNKVLGLVSAVISLLGYFTARFVWLPFSIQSGLFAVFLLWVGYTVKRNDILERLRFYHYIIGIVIFLGGIYFGYCYIAFVTADIKDLLISTAVGLAGALLVYGAGRLIHNSRFFGWLGRNSMTVLCIHLISLDTLWPYYHGVMDLLGLSGNAGVWMRISLELTAAILGTFLLELIRTKVYQNIKQKWLAKRSGEAALQTRMPAVDIARGILIISMLIGHFEISPALRNVIYSCHMIAFVFLSGYFYKQDESIGKIAKRMLRTFLLPYLICFLCEILLDVKLWSGAYFGGVLSKYLLGMSFSRKLFPNAASVGPVYFILMLFVVRILYKLIDIVAKKEIVKWILVIGFTGAGIFLGSRGFWLPWSIDVAFYCLFFYQLGVVFKRYELLKKVTDNGWLYFVLSPIWFYMIYKGGMEIAVRKYKDYGLVVAGALAGILLICCLSAYFEHNALFSSKALAFTGRASIVIIIIHTLINSRLNQLLGRFLGTDGFAFLIVSIVIQIAVSCLIYAVIMLIKKRRRTSLL